MRLKNAIHANTYIRGYPMPTLYIADAERDADMKNLSRKEAAKVLEDMKSKGEIPKAAVTQWKRNTALDMAIEALKYSEVPNSSDCISRQAAIDALGEKPLVWDDLSDFDLGKAAQWSDDVDAIKELPSAQPQHFNLDENLLTYAHDMGVTLEQAKKELQKVTEQPQLDEWCDTCKEYDQERHCCPRFNHVIRTTLDDVKREAYKHGKSKGIKRGMAMARRKEAEGD